MFPVSELFVELYSEGGDAVYVVIISRAFSLFCLQPNDSKRFPSSPAPFLGESVVQRAIFFRIHPLKSNLERQLIWRTSIMIER